MWVTQTYLATVEPGAKLFIYYFFEDYDSEQKAFTDRVQKELEKLGEMYRDQVCLMMPNKRYANKVEGELLRFDSVDWQGLAGRLPGLFLSRKPLTQIQPGDDGQFYIPFKGKDPKSVADTIDRVRQLASDTLVWDHGHPPAPPEPEGAGKRLWDAVELKPGIWGFRLDLKKLISK